MKYIHSNTHTHSTLCVYTFDKLIIKTECAVWAVKVTQNFISSRKLSSTPEYMCVQQQQHSLSNGVVCLVSRSFRNNMGRRQLTAVSWNRILFTLSQVFRSVFANSAKPLIKKQIEISCIDG